MTTTIETDVDHDRHDVAIHAAPDPVLGRSQEEAPTAPNNAKLASTSTVRGRETVPVVVP